MVKKRQNISNQDEINSKRIKLDDNVDPNSYLMPCIGTAKKLSMKNEKKKSLVNDKPVLSKKQIKENEKAAKKRKDKQYSFDLRKEIELTNKIYDEIEKKRMKVIENDKSIRENLTDKIKGVSKKKRRKLRKQALAKFNKMDSSDESEQDDPKKDDTKASGYCTSDFSSDEEIIVIKPMETDEIQEAENLDVSHTESIVGINETHVPEPIETVLYEPIEITPIPHVVKEEIKVEIKPKPASYILVNRKPEIQEERMNLPVVAEESTIMEAISTNDVVIITGATGSGKTTQIPQFLYEANYTANGKMIGITEPRRVAAMTMANRVSIELNMSPESQMVGYHIRFDKSAHCGTKIKFMTDGILLQQVKEDYILREYSAIIIDEAHERSAFSDVLIGFLARVVKLRRFNYTKQMEKIEKGIPLNENPNSVLLLPPLKLIIMSATLSVRDFADNDKLFPIRPPVVEIPGKMFPVGVYYNRYTRTNYLEDAFKKVVEIHQTTKDGSILVFVTGQQDCETLCRWLRLAFPVSHQFLKNVEKEQLEHGNQKRLSVNQQIKKMREQNHNEKSQVLQDFSIIPKDEEMDLYDVKMDSSDNEESDYEEVFEDETLIKFNDIVKGVYKKKHCDNPINALPLYSILSREKQDLVFQPTPFAQRNVIVSTNIAETSLTIPNVKYVVDTGLEKIKVYNMFTGLNQFKLAYVSKSSAEQRKGRAGRLGPGSVYRLYSSQVYEEMKDFPVPEILNRPLDDVLLNIYFYMKNNRLLQNKIPELPSMPSPSALEYSRNTLKTLGALKRVIDDKYELTYFGERMIELSLVPRYARMVLLGSGYDVLPYIVTMVSGLSVTNLFPFTNTVNDKEEDQECSSEQFKKNMVKRKSDLELGDLTVLMGTISKLDSLRQNKSDTECKLLAEKCGIRWRAYLEICDIRKQLISILNSNFNVTKKLDTNIILKQPTIDQFSKIRQIVTMGSPMNVACKNNIFTGATVKERKAIKNSYIGSNTDGLLFIDRSSILEKHQFNWVVYQDLLKREVHNNNSKLYMQTIIAIEPEWLPLRWPTMCETSKLILKLENSQSPDDLPFYSHVYDGILGTASKILYGERKLELPSHVTKIKLSREMMVSEENLLMLLSWFGRFILEATVIPAMEPLSGKIKSFLKTEYMVHPRFRDRVEVKSMIRDMKELDDFTKDCLKRKWKKDPKFLLDTMKAWIVPTEHESLSNNWPPKL